LYGLDLVVVEGKNAKCDGRAVWRVLLRRLAMEKKAAVIGTVTSDE
jgi:hypothetical protein